MHTNILIVQLKDIEKNGNPDQEAIVTFSLAFNTSRVTKILLLPNQDVCFVYEQCACGNSKPGTLTQCER